MKTAIFLGAGASKAEGAPLQTELFRDYFKYAIKNNQHSPMFNELVTFFDFIFKIDIYNSNLDEIIFPNFEEVLGILDLAVLRDESYKNYDLENIAINSGRIRDIRKYLVLLMAEIIDVKLRHYLQLHDTLVRNLHSNDVLFNTMFVSTNYDILIDNALERLHYNVVDYGIELEKVRGTGRFRSYVRNEFSSRNNVKLFKIHGSLNWLRCPTCSKVFLTQGEKGVATRLLNNIAESLCPICESILVPIIVPPTYFKDMSNVFLSTIWSKIENSLKEIETIIFCGYSFPDADIHLKYILKRAQINGGPRNLNIIVINNHPGKDIQMKKDEEMRYMRFFGPNVRYTNQNFEGFVENPLKYM